MTREELKHITDLCFTTPMAIRRSGEKKTYHAEEIAEAKRTVMELLEQEPKTGHWISNGRTVRCSECDSGYNTVKGMRSAVTYNFCPNCGCRMMEVEHD